MLPNVIVSPGPPRPARREKALIVIDQLGLASFAGRAHAVHLGYIPRTTPVGHATISTGQLPSAHGIQGREWFVRQGAGLTRRDINDLPLGAFDPAHSALLAASSMSRAIRARSRDARIVVAAAKAFIPFLFGASDSDVCVYPTDVRPRRTSPSSQPVLAVRVHPFTAAGSATVARCRAWLYSRMLVLVMRIDPQGTLAFRNAAGGILELHWRVSPPLVARAAWLAAIDRWGPEIDRCYGEMAAYLLGNLDGPSDGYLIHSWFSTDMRAHLHGNTHGDYHDAVDHALRYAAQLAATGSVVAITSDHGGRPTPQHLGWNGAQATDHLGNQILLRGAAQILLSGDHLVGYDLGGHGCPVEYWDGARLRAAALPPRLIVDSFAPSQMPAWLTLPRITEKFGDPALVNGGDHGACVDQGTLSGIDDTVPALVMGPAAQAAMPNRLHEVAGWFLGL
jgi:hypothetical protein